MTHSLGTIWGEVLLWGHVYDHDLGYRAEFAQLKNLYHHPGYGVPLKRLQEIADSYGVPIVHQPPETMVALIEENRERAKSAKAFSARTLAGAILRLAWDGAKADVARAFREAIDYVRRPNGRDR